MVKLKGQDVSQLIPEGEVVHARLQEVEERSFTHELQKIDKLHWRFLVTDEAFPSWNGKEVFGDTSTSFSAHPNCKAYNWVTALTGKQYGVDDELDTDVLIGLPCKVIIGHKPDNQGRTWMRVREVLPARAAVSSPEDPPF